MVSILFTEGTDDRVIETATWPLVPRIGERVRLLADADALGARSQWEVIYVEWVAARPPSELLCVRLVVRRLRHAVSDHPDLAERMAMGAA